jgi:hypothetical protein
MKCELIMKEQNRGIVVVPACHEVLMTKGDHDYPYVFLTYFVDLNN